MGRQVAGHGHVLLERLGLVGQHVGPMVGEALVLHHPHLPFRPGIGRRDRPRPIRHRLGRVGDVARRSADCDPPAAARRRACRSAGSRACASSASFGGQWSWVTHLLVPVWNISASGCSSVALVLEMAGEQRRLHLVAEVLARGAVEGDLAELVPRPRSPAAVVPGADHQEVLVLACRAFPAARRS